MTRASKHFNSRKLTKPAQIGNTIFCVGVSECLVIERAQHEYEYIAASHNKIYTLENGREDMRLKVRKAVSQLERDRHELIEALQSICNGDIGPDGQYHFTFSGSQCVKIATQILERMK